MNIIKNFDIFSQPVQFNAYNQKIRKRTFCGAFLTVSILVTTLIIIKLNKFVYFNLDLKLQENLSQKVEETQKKDEENDNISEKSSPIIIPYTTPKLAHTRFTINSDFVNEEQQCIQDQNSIFTSLEYKAEQNRIDGSRVQSARVYKKRINSISNKNSFRQIQQKNKFKINLLNSNLTKQSSPTSFNNLSLQQKSPTQQDTLQKTYTCTQTVIDPQKQQSLFQTLSKKIKALSEKPISQKVQNLLFKTILCKRRKFLESQGLNKQKMLDLEEQVNESLDYFSVYKDIIMLKKAIFVLLSKEQLAALQLVGFTDNQDRSLTDLNSKRDLYSPKSINESNKNYFQEQFKIHKSSEIQSQYIYSFLLKCQNQQNMSLVDERLLSSLQITQYN
ncbi:hypothetical protein ABPG73_011031 [Tetrahymena malaccensis]